MTGTIGWLGTGRMGSAIVGRLLDAGRPVTVWNRTAAKTAPLAARGATVAAGLAGLGACDVVFVMVTGSADLEQVTIGDGGLLTGAARPAILVDCSTVSQEASARVRAAATAAGVGFLAAPVCGNPGVIADGLGSFIVSGPVEVFNEIRPDLERVAAIIRRRVPAVSYGLYVILMPLAPALNINLAKAEHLKLIGIVAIQAVVVIVFFFHQTSSVNERLLSLELQLSAVRQAAETRHTDDQAMISEMRHDIKEIAVKVLKGTGK